MRTFTKPLLGIALAAILSAAAPAPANTPDPTFVRVDDKHVLNLSQISELVFQQEVIQGQTKPTWVIVVQLVGIKDTERIYFDQEKPARDAWDHILVEMGVR